MVLFFFSSRRRHTISYGDWSSDVCSSDLGDEVGQVVVLADLVDRQDRRVAQAGDVARLAQKAIMFGAPTDLWVARHLEGDDKIGRASCRERLSMLVAVVSVLSSRCVRAFV